MVPSNRVVIFANGTDEDLPPSGAVRTTRFPERKGKCPGGDRKERQDGPERSSVRAARHSRKDRRRRFPAGRKASAIQKIPVLVAAPRLSSGVFHIP